MLFDKIINVEWRQVSGQYNNYVYQPHPLLQGIPANIQPIQPEFTNDGNGMNYKTSRMYCTASGIVEGFRITVSGSNDRYIVRGRQSFDYIVAPHYELIIEDDTQ